MIDSNRFIPAIAAGSCLLAVSLAVGQDVNGQRSDTTQAQDPEVILALMQAWGPCDEGPCPADLNQDGTVDSEDLALLISGDVFVPVHQLVPKLASGPDLRTCRVEPMPGVVIFRAKSALGGGMTGNGWDGAGQNAATIYWYMENTTPDFAAGQRQALIDAMAAWAGAVQITWREVALDNVFVAVDWAYRTGDHSAFEPAEAGDPDCPFDGAGGVVAHAGFPPGVNQSCGGISAETKSGNVHFDEAETWEQDSEGGASTLSLTLIACHEVGHSIGLTHDTSGGGDVMRPTFGFADTFVGLTADDIANIQGGYASGSGSVVTLNNSGIWVDGGFAGVERGNNSTNPVNTLIEGVNGVPPFTSGIVVHIQAGSYAETMTITDSMVLQAEGGTVTIGN